MKITYKPYLMLALVYVLGLCVPVQCRPLQGLKTSVRTVVPPTGGLSHLPECSSCNRDSQCRQGKCWGSPLRCTDGTYQSLVRCGFGRECATCTTGLQCSTLHCRNGRCVFDPTRDSPNCPTIISHPTDRPCPNCQISV